MGCIKQVTHSEGSFTISDMSIVRLSNVGHLSTEPAVQEDGKYEKDVILVHEGEFSSMDGPVEITPQIIEMMVDTHNSRLSKLKKLANGDYPMKECPPIQLDHSTSATMTVGRLVGPLSSERITTSDGKTVLAAKGRMRILGKENQEKVEDGRWCHVSIGADLGSGHLSELSITPFPADPNASMLSKLMNGRSTGKQTYRVGYEYEIFVEKDGTVSGYIIYFDGKKVVEKHGPQAGQFVQIAERWALRDIDYRWRNELDNLSRMSRHAAMLSKLAKHKSTEKFTVGPLKAEIDIYEENGVDTYYVSVYGPNGQEYYDVNNYKNGPYSSRGEAQNAIKRIAGRVHFKNGSAHEVVQTGTHEGVKYEIEREPDGKYTAYVLLEDGWHETEGYETQDAAMREMKAIVANPKKAPEKLSRSKRMARQVKTKPGPFYKGFETEVEIWEEDADWVYAAKAYGTSEAGIANKVISTRIEYVTEQEAIKAIKQKIDQQKLSRGGKLMKFATRLKKLFKLSEEKDEEKKEAAKMSEAEEKAEKLKKHLMDEEKLSAEEAEEKLTSMTDDEVKSLSEKMDEKDRLARASEESEETEEEAKMAEAKEQLKKLAKSLVSKHADVQLAAKKAKVSARLSTLRKERKITPAELKKIDVVSLAAMPTEQMLATLRTYEQREPVIDTTVHGSQEAVSIGSIAEKYRLRQLEIETRLQWPSKAQAARAELSAMQKEQDEEIAAAKAAGKFVEMSEGDYVPSYAKLCELVDSGSKDELKVRLKGIIEAKGETEFASASEKQMSELDEKVNLMHDEIKQVLTLVAQITGTNVKEF